MSIPAFQEFMMPTLKFINSKDIASTSDIIANICKVFNFSEQEKKSFYLIPNKQKSIIELLGLDTIY